MNKTTLTMTMTLHPAPPLVCAWSSTGAPGTPLVCTWRRSRPARSQPAGGQAPQLEGGEPRLCA